MGFLKLLIGWALSMAIYAAIVGAWHAAKGQATSGFVEGLLGLGLLLAIPSFIFTLVAGWPTMSLLAGLRPAWLLPLAAAAALALLMWVLAMLALPEGCAEPDTPSSGTPPCWGSSGDASTSRLGLADNPVTPDGRLGRLRGAFAPLRVIA